MTDNLSVTTPAEGQRLLAKLVTESVKVLGVQFSRVRDVGLLPVVRIDVRNRPDLADLARVHRTEGEGDHEHRFEFIGSIDGAMLAVVRLELLRPVHTELLLSFDVGQRRQWLRGIVKVGAFGTLFEDPRRPTPQRRDLIGWQIDPRPLADGLMLYDLSRQGPPVGAQPPATRPRPNQRSGR